MWQLCLICFVPYFNSDSANSMNNGEKILQSFCHKSGNFSRGNPGDPILCTHLVNPLDQRRIRKYQIYWSSHYVTYKAVLHTLPWRKLRRHGAERPGLSSEWSLVPGQKIAM